MDDAAATRIDEVSEELRKQRDLLSAIGDGTPALLCLVFEDGRILPEGMNRSGHQMIGGTHESLRDKVFWEMAVAPDDRAAVAEVVRRVAAGESQPETLSRWLTVDGTAFVAWMCTRLPDVIEVPVFLISGIDVTERERQAQELRESRSRIVVAADAERRRLERNLHDGAQQRLVSLALTLRQAESALPGAPDRASELLRDASAELAEAIAELRELARGLHPALLTDRGLAPALDALAERVPVPVTVRNEVDMRLPEPVEAAAYYLVAEALTNVAKHARASEVTVSVDLVEGALSVVVADDGVGGAEPELGSGLRGLADRVEAVSGRFAFASGAGGTRVTAEIPVSSE